MPSTPKPREPSLYLVLSACRDWQPGGPGHHCRTGATVASVLEDCGKAGVKAAVVITAGFSEAGNKAGEAGILLLPGNTASAWLVPTAPASSTPAQNCTPPWRYAPRPGAWPWFRRAGALGGVVLAWAEEQGLGISKFVSYGNGSRSDPGGAAALPGRRSGNRRGRPLYRKHQERAGVYAMRWKPAAGPNRWW